MGQADKAGHYAGMRVLVVDDNYDAASALALLVELWGYDVRVGHDGQSAMAAFDQFRPQAVLLDIGLPGMSGYETARRIRRIEAAEGRDPALLVAITGYGSADDMAQAWDAGFDHHLLKPSDPLFLERLLQGHVTGTLRPIEARDAAPRAGAAEESLEPKAGEKGATATWVCGGEVPGSGTLSGETLA